MKKLKMLIAISLVLILTCISAIPLCFAVTPDKVYTVGDKLTFGKYPQSFVENERIVENLLALSESKEWTSYEYRYLSDDGKEVIPGDFMHYIDLEYNGDMYRGVSITDYRPSGSSHRLPTAAMSVQNQNGYSAGNIYWFKYEPIEWIVLDPQKGLMTTTMLLDSQSYCFDQGEFPGWQYSEIRKWLKNEFYTIAFSPEEKLKIFETEIITDLNDTRKQTTYDKVFLLSTDDVSNPDYGFVADWRTDDKLCQMKGTDYAKSQNLKVYNYPYYEGNSYWWLRSPYKNAPDSSYASTSRLVCHCTDRGQFNGGTLDETTMGIRPAMCIDMTPIYYVKGISISDTYKEVPLGTSFNLSATVNPTNATDSSVTWTSDNTDVATVTQDGKVTAKSTGDAYITVTANDKTNGTFTAKCLVTVYKIDVTDIKLNYTSKQMYEGESFGLSVTVLPSDAYDKSVTWKSSDSNVAEVSQNGYVTAKNEGEAYITVTADDKTNGTISAKCKVNVLSLNITDVKINSMPNKTEYFADETLSTYGLTLRISYNNGTSEIINNGFECNPTTFDSEGTKTITVSYKGFEESFNVSVKPARIDISKAWISEIPVQGYNPEGIYKPKFTVTYNGEVLKEGVDYTVTYGDERVIIYGINRFTGLNGKFYEVKYPDYNGFKVTPETLSLNYKTSAKLTAELLYPEYADEKIIWSSSDDDIVSVSSNGTIVATGDGEAYISVTTESGYAIGSCKVTVTYTWWQWIIRILLLGFIWY